jgi:hypothetical protein
MANVDWEQMGNRSKQAIPGLRICVLQEGNLRDLTRPRVSQADLPLALSPDGSLLAFLRLNQNDEGSLYLMGIKDGRMAELASGLEISGGYYYNYYPDSVSVYWTAR